MSACLCQAGQTVEQKHILSSIIFLIGNGMGKIQVEKYYVKQPYSTIP